MISRTLGPRIERMLRDWGKMVFISGPRQVGKTTLAGQIADGRGGGQSFNWDVITDQKRLLKQPYFFSEHTAPGQRLVLFDEIHKYARWKNYLKGAFDRYGREYNFLVLGSGRLDLYRRGGDSLMGRYLSVPLLPLTIGELAGKLPSFEQFQEVLTGGPPPESSSMRETFAALHSFGGFPEPFTRQQQAFYNLWMAERRTLLMRQDIRDATRIREISLLEMLANMLPERVGSPLSINSLREDLGVAFETVRDWMKLLAQFYYVFLVPPFTGGLARTLRKEQKAYLFDWAEIDAPGARFENLVALHLYKATSTWKALGEGEFRLCYLRDKEKREVDFVVVKRRQPVCLLEAKLQETEPAKHLEYFQARLDLPVVQLVRPSGVMRRLGRGRRSFWIVSADRWLACLP